MERTKTVKSIVGIITILVILLLAFYYIRVLNRPREFQQGVFVQRMQEDLSRA